MSGFLRFVAVGVVALTLLSPVFPLGGPAYEWKGNPDILLPTKCNKIRLDRVSVKVRCTIPEYIQYLLRRVDPREYSLEAEHTVTYRLTNTSKQTARVLLAFPWHGRNIGETPVAQDGKALPFRVIELDTLNQKAWMQAFRDSRNWIQSHGEVRQKIETIRQAQIRPLDYDFAEGKLKEELIQYVTRSLGKSRAFAETLAEVGPKLIIKDPDITSDSFENIMPEISPAWIYPRSKLYRAWHGVERGIDPVSGAWFLQPKPDWVVILLRTEIVLRPGQRSTVVTRQEAYWYWNSERYRYSITTIPEPLEAMKYWSGSPVVDFEVRSPKDYLVQTQPRATHRGQYGTEQVVATQFAGKKGPLGFGLMHLEGLLPVVFVNGERNWDPVGLRKKEGVWFIPFLQEFGRLNWRIAQEDRGAEIFTGTKMLLVTPGSQTAYLDGKPVQLTVAPYIFRDRTMVPLQVLSLLSTTPPKITFSPDERRCWIALNQSTTPSAEEESAPPLPTPERSSAEGD